MVNDMTQPQAFEATWESLENYQCPDWFRDAKFGIYAHWGPYSVPEGPGNTDWYSRQMYVPDHAQHRFHREKYGPVEDFGYKDLIPLFKGERFDASEWADLFAEAGAQFAGPVAEHADGYSMWASKISPWNAADTGPRRDIVAELGNAVRKRGLKFVTSFHHQWKWGWYPTLDTPWDTLNPEFEKLYGPAVPSTAFSKKLPSGKVTVMVPNPMPTLSFANEWLDKVKEVVENYKPDLLYFDNRMQILPERIRIEMAAFYYNRAIMNGQPVVLTYKKPDLKLGTATLDLERNRMAEIYPEPWLTDTSIARSSWAFASDLEYYSADRLVHDLVDIVSKNGCVLLNIAPAPDGTIPLEQKERLRAIGGWLKQNGEAIYGSRPWLIYGEGPTVTPLGHLSDMKFQGFCSQDIRFTTKDGSLYAIALGQPDPNEGLRIRSLGSVQYPGNVLSVSLLGSEVELAWKRTDDGLLIQIPEDIPGAFAPVFKIILE